jgi:hypothetical protein
MGESANDILEGMQCQWCGVMFTRPHGFPVACEWCWHEEYRKRVISEYGNDATDEEKREIWKEMPHKAMHKEL